MPENVLESLRAERENWPWEAKAREELNEDPETAKQMLFDLKEKIKQYSSDHKNFRPQTDDDFLMAFLRTRKFDLEKAFAGYCNFYKIRLCNPEKILPVGKGPKNYTSAYMSPIGSVLEKSNPSDGTIVFIWSFRNFDFSKDGIEDVVNITWQIILELIPDPSIQAYGFRFIFDLQGLNYSIVIALISRFYLRKAILLTQNSSPMRFKGFHVINGPMRATKIVFHAFRPFLPKKVLERLHFHGSHEELHEFVSPKILPDIFGGEAGPWCGARLKEAMDERHDEIVRKSYFGYITL